MDTAGRAACGRPRLCARLRQGVPGRSARERRQPEEGDRHLRAHAGVAADALRSLDRGRAMRCRRRRSKASGCSPARPAAPTAMRAGPSPTTRSTTSGLPSEDRGRGAVLRLEAAEHAFKTPSLREVGRRAPYMHDGSLATLADVVRHYADGIVDRPTLPPDLAPRTNLREAEQAALLAFLGTLTSEGDPQPPAAIVAAKSPAVPAARVTSVSQHDKTFTPTHVRIRRGERLWILNNDTRTHNIRVFDEKLDFDSGAQEPGETVRDRVSEGRLLSGLLRHPSQDGTRRRCHQIASTRARFRAASPYFRRIRICETHLRTRCSHAVANCANRPPRQSPLPISDLTKEKRMKRRQFLKTAGTGACRDRNRQPRHRAIHARNEMAPDLQLSEVARHDLRRGGSVLQGGGRSDRQQIPDPGVRRGRDRARPAGRRRGDQRHRRDVPHRVLLLCRQGSDLCVRHRRSVRPQQPHAERLAVFRRRPRADERLLQEGEHLRHSRAATPAVRWAAGSARRSRSRPISAA